MKRFLSLLTVFVLALALAVPVGASDSHYVFGEWYFNDTLTAKSPSQTVNFIANGKQYIAFGNLSSINKAHIWAYYDSDHTDTPYDNGTWRIPEFRTIDFGSKQEVSTGFYNWLVANAVPIVCDGSACPANDVNADDVCDDCGRVLSLRATAPEYPTPPTVSGAYKHYVLSKASSGRYDYSVFVSDTPFTVRGERGSVYVANFSDTATVYRYSSSNGNDWELNTNGFTVNSFTIGSNGALELVQSTFTWYDESGAPFFPKPLYQTMGEVVAEEMPELSQTMGGTMRTLMACGVGCLALLVVLKLFGSRSLLFRG